MSLARLFIAILGCILVGLGIIFTSLGQTNGTGLLFGGGIVLLVISGFIKE